MVISEAPIMAPLVPLAEFVAGVGPPPPREALHTYLARLREQVLSTPKMRHVMHFITPSKVMLSTLTCKLLHAVQCGVNVGAEARHAAMCGVLSAG